MRGRSFSSRATHHIYQRCKDKGVLFYTLEDRLVYYTLAACKARVHGVKVLAAALMYTHIHQSIMARSIDDVHSYLHDTNTSFCRLYNHRYRRNGVLLERRPGHSQKHSSKDVRSNLAYVFNNHVEKGLCSRAIEERWSFLAYAISDHPYSEPLLRKDASAPLRRALNLVERRISRLKGLEYSDLDKIINLLSVSEREQFMDFVITKYALIDFSCTVRHFMSLESMIMAMDTTTGSEFEIREDYTRLKDTEYLTVISDLEKKGAIRNIYVMSGTELMDRIVYYSQAMNIHPDHLRRLFHCDFLISRGK